MCSRLEIRFFPFLSVMNAGAVEKQVLRLVRLRLSSLRMTTKWVGSWMEWATGLMGHSTVQILPKKRARRVPGPRRETVVHRGVTPYITVRLKGAVWLRVPEVPITITLLVPTAVGVFFEL